MKTFEQLRQIAEAYTIEASNLPANPFQLCSRLQIAFKTKEQYLKDYNSPNLFERTPAILSKLGAPQKPENVIYYNENTHYWRFYIFHELSHYILDHEADGNIEEQEANMLACLLIAPIHSVPTFLKCAHDLSQIAQIPIAHAEEYWKELCNIGYNRKRLKRIRTRTTIVICLFWVVLGVIFFAQYTTSKNTTSIPDPILPPTVTPFIQSELTQADEHTTYYITPTGTKYHLPDCQYVKNNSNIISITNPQEQGYLPCKVCLK